MGAAELGTAPPPARSALGLGGRFLVTALVILVGVFLAIGLSEGFADRHSERARLLERIDAVGRLVALAATEPLLERDFERLDTLCQQAQRDPEILYVVALDGDRPLAGVLDWSQPALDPLLHTSGRYPDLAAAIAAIDRLPTVRRRIFPIRIGDERLAELVVGFAAADLEQRLRAGVVRKTAAAVAVGGLLGVVLLVLFRLQVQRPLQTLLAGIARARRPDGWTPVPVRRDDAVGALANAFNGLMAELARQHRALGRRGSELLRLQRFLHDLIDSMPSIVAAIDTTGRVTHWNLGAERETGIRAGDAIGRRLDELLPRLAVSMPAFIDAIRRGQPYVEPKVEHAGDHGPCFEDRVLYPLLGSDHGGGVVRIDDQSERVQMERMVVQVEKMKSMGHLAAGMAHEINNPLAGILQNAQVCRLRIDADHPRNLEAARGLSIPLDRVRSYLDARGVPAMIDAIIASGERAGRIVDNMLRFTRARDSRMLPVDLGELIGKSLELCRGDYDLESHYDFRQIAIESEIDPALPSVECEPGEIQQVLLNLLQNGAHAMRSNPPERTPRLRIRALRDGETARIEIEDNGSGISESLRKRIFDPFFTTKQVGEGTGLGLAVCYFIVVDGHGGRIDVADAAGGGTRFTVWLPLVSAPAAAEG